MGPDEFFIAEQVDGPWGPERGRRLDTDLVASLRAAPHADLADTTVAVALAQLVDDELQCYGTAGGEALTNDQMALCLRTLSAVLKRLGVDFSIPWRDFNTFRTYWIKNGAAGSGGWQARRDIVNEFFEPLHARLFAIEDRALESNLAQPISPRDNIGWPRVDQEIRELRRRFASASTPQDYRAIGTHCVGVVEALGAIVYRPSVHLRPGESVPAPDKTKQRIGRFIEDALAGPSNEEVRGVANKTIELAHRVKHGTTPTRRDAGIAGDAVILLANILRRIAQSETDQKTR